MNQESLDLNINADDFLSRLDSTVTDEYKLVDDLYKTYGDIELTSQKNNRHSIFIYRDAENGKISCSIGATKSRELFDDVNQVVEFINTEIAKANEESKKVLGEAENSKTIEEQFDTIIDIIGANTEDIIGGLLYINELSFDELRQIITEAPDYWNPDSEHNGAPSNQTFADFIEANPQFVAEAHLYTPSRTDYIGIDIVGVKAPLNKENKNILYTWVNEDIENYCEDPSEYGEYNGNIRAWWD